MTERLRYPLKTNRRQGRWRTHLALVYLISIAATAHGQEHHRTKLGKVDFPISCSEQAQSEFNHAMGLLHHMTYPQARVAFENLAKRETNCAMAHWGIAMTLFQPLWPTRPGLQDRRRGWEAVAKAKSLEVPTERERRFIAAAEAFFQEPDSDDYWLRIRRWEAEAAKMYAAMPDDTEAAIFYALAHLATTPAKTISRTHADRAASILIGVYEKNPDHPGAMHYLVHANDVPGRERELIEVTRKYESIAPRNPHALHMPTHIYTRLGEWEMVIRGNRLAAEAALEHRAGPKGEYVWDEFPHAIEYMVYAHLQQGADKLAEAQLKRLLATRDLEPTFKTAFHIASIQARYALERRDWARAAALRPREPAELAWDKFPWPEAITRFAQGMGSLKMGRVAEAESAQKAIEKLETTARAAGEDLFARNIRVLALELRAFIENARRDEAAALSSIKEALDLEMETPKHAVTPGPLLPAHELMGDLFMELKRPSRALEAYSLSMKFYPGRFNSLLGAARAANAAGEKVQAASFYNQLITLAVKGDRKTEIQEARKNSALR